jgi:hypothetical protein
MPLKTPRLSRCLVSLAKNPSTARQTCLCGAVPRSDHSFQPRSREVQTDDPPFAMG